MGVDSLTMIDKAHIARMAIMNASYRPREGKERSVFSDAAIKTEEIKTLAEYRAMNTEKLSTWNPEREDNNKLMRTYVIPIQLPSGEEIDLIVNAKGQDMACVYRDEEGNMNSFHLTSRMQKEILKDALGEEFSKEDFAKIQTVLLPKTLEDFTEKVEKDKLVPEGKKDIKKRMKDSGNKIQDEDEKEEGLTIEEAAAATGLSEDILEKFANENGRILGIRVTDDVEGLSKQINFEIDSPNVIMIRVNDGANKDKGYILSPDGKILYSSLDGRGNPELITDLVNTGSVGDNIDNIDKAIEDKQADCKKVVYENPVSGKKDIQYAEKGTAKEIDGYESDAKTILMEKQMEIEAIKSMDIEDSEKFKLMGEKTFEAAKKMDGLQTEYGVLETQSVRDLTSEANYYGECEQKSLMKEGFLNVGENVMDTVLDIVTPPNKSSGYDDRDKMAEREGGRMPLQH